MPAVSIRLPHAVPLGKVDASITIDKHGELYISKGTVEMRPLGKQNHVYTLSWTKLMRLFEEHGKPAVKPTKSGWGLAAGVAGEAVDTFTSRA